MSRGHSIIMRTELTRKTAIDLVASLPVNHDRPIWHVTVKPYKKNRSLDQNSLLHMWIQDIANETGNEVGVVKEYLRMKYLAPAPKEWKDPLTGEINIIETPRSTTTLTVHEMTAFLNHIQQFSLDMGIALRDPEELKWVL